MGRKAHIFPGFSSGPLLFGCTDGQGPGTDGLVLENRFGLGQGGELAEEVLFSTGQYRTKVLRLALLHKDNLVVLLHDLVF